MAIAWDFGTEDYREPDTAPVYAEEDCVQVGPFAIAYCEECKRNTTHGDFYFVEDDDNPVKVGFGCSVCYLLVGRPS